MQNIPELKTECIECMIKARLRQCPETASEADKVIYMRKTLEEISAMHNQHGPTIATRHIYDMQKEMFGLNDSYWALRERFNHIMMEKERTLRAQIRAAKDPLKMAIQFGIVGNYIDFIVMEKVDEAKVEELLQEASSYVIDDVLLEQFRVDILNAERIVFLTDNCGEIVIDKLMMELIQEMNPLVEITAIVRGKEILNDATMEDAIQIGLPETVTVIDNGDDMPGTCLYRISSEAKELIESVDLVVSKGQGNFETLQGCNLNVYYIFLCKCNMIAEKFSVPKFHPMFVKE